VQRLEKHLEREVGGLLVAARHSGVQRAVGTSGTVNALVAMARAARGDEVGRLHGSAASASELGRLRRRLVHLPTSQRAELPGMDAKRVDLMPAAAVLTDFVVSRAGVPALVACGWALREGVLLELAGAGRDAGAEGQRTRSVEALAARFAGTGGHGRQVARLALALFDETAAALGLPPSARELLEYAALLHDIGHAIDHDRHQHHSCYLVRNAELVGFDRLEVEVVAQVVRGHRKQMPKPGDPELRALPGAARRVVRGLAALLRVADALDRTHFGVVHGLEVALTPHRLTIGLEVGGDDPELELWAAERRVDLLSRLLERRVILRRNRPVAARPMRARAGAS
jgi:exopolyphosphatase/guanosine-5'-triphosphate,3'-diphosphate pyrophosphatase